MPTELTLASRLVNTLNDKTSAQKIGYSYIKSLSHPTHLSLLVAKITSRSSREFHFLTKNDTSGFQKAVSYKIHQDFVEGNLVVVEGWYLSETEAQLCALATMT